MPTKTGENKELLWMEKRSRRWIPYVAIGFGVLVVAVVGILVFGGTGKNTDSGTTTDGTATQAALVRRVLDGVYVPSGQENLFPAAVMVENLVAARPQSGLAKANVVYEALAEGGITRFMAVYASPLAGLREIGPVRSARPYYLDWVGEYHALYLHAGGSPQALQDIKRYNVFDLSQFTNGPYYKRIKYQP
ncbi:MAG: DUF3048 domain-containing protein, partial [Patescibacteria group bacterium]